ncbi:MAG: HAMP domain-containing sensor histidine kinase [Planctomycetota bacterium]|nr:HAMP domain-containing sensor histidine kinase [Planctomycetota bacterium]
MFQRSSLAWPIVLASVLVPLIVALLVMWVVDQTQAQRWVLLVIGVIVITVILFGVVAYFYWTIREVRLNIRQANFLDAVTHELKSPIASMKLCLQTLDLRTVTAEQQRELHRFMLEDIQRLDGLIDHMLTIARLGAEPTIAQVEIVFLPTLLRRCIDEVRRRYDLDAERITLTCEDCLVPGRERDLEMVFLNLLDNAVKYGGKEPRVIVECKRTPRGRIQTRISDSGSGISFDLRRKIFQRFYRGGSELERTTKGTGLGLHIVKSLVGRMKGKVIVHGRGPLSGATFEVDLPGHIASDRGIPSDASPPAANRVDTPESSSDTVEPNSAPASPVTPLPG